METFYNILTVIYLSMILRIVIAGFKKYKELQFPFQFMFWSAVLDFITELLGTVTTLLDIVNTKLFIVYSVLSFCLYLLFINYSNSNMQFNLRRRSLLLLPISILALIFIYGKNFFNINFYSYIISCCIIVILTLYSILVAIKKRNVNFAVLGFYVFIFITATFDFAITSFFDLIIYVFKSKPFEQVKIVHLAYGIFVYYFYYRLLFSAAQTKWLFQKKHL